MEWYFYGFSHYVDFNGRARLQEFWMFFLLNIIFAVFLHIGDTLIFGLGNGTLLLPIYMLIALMPSLAVTVRRLHDIGRCGWWILLWLIPIFGTIALAILCALPGEIGDNRYGRDPLAKDEDE